MFIFKKAVQESFQGGFLRIMHILCGTSRDGDVMRAHTLSPSFVAKQMLGWFLCLAWKGYREFQATTLRIFALSLSAVPQKNLRTIMPFQNVSSP